MLCTANLRRADAQYLILCSCLLTACQVVEKKGRSASDIHRAVDYSLPSKNGCFWFSDCAIFSICIDRHV